MKLYIRDVSSRWPFYALVALLGCECLACFIGGYMEWTNLGFIVSTYPAEAAEQASFAVELYAIGALNLVASIAFLLRRAAWGWWVVSGMQTGIFVLALVEGVLIDLGWYYLSSVALLTLFLLLAFRKAHASLKPSVAGNLTTI